MKRATLLVCTIICLMFTACKKEKQYSTWYVNSDSFSTNEAETSIGKAIAKFSSLNHDNKNYFRIGFNVGYLPTEGQYKIEYNSTTSIFSGISFYYNGVFFISSPNTENYLYASSNSGKASYSLPATWFINYDNHEDSVLIKGTFNEP
jgi:hypothetical protein